METLITENVKSEMDLAINTFDYSHARNSALDFLANKYCNYWELEQMIKIFNFNIQSHGNVELNHDNIITIDYSVKFESNKEY